MKKQAITTIAKRFFFGNLLAAALFLSANTASASINTNHAFDPAKAEVKYTGVDKDNLLAFKVKYSNPAANTFTLSVLDENGESIFKSFYDEANFDKTFKLPKSEVSKVTFVIEDLKSGLKEKYTVNVKTTVQDEVTVSKN